MNKTRIFLVFATLLLSGQSFAQTTKATIQGEISSSTANGLLGGTILNNIVLSYVDWTTCSGTGGIVYWNAGTPTCLNAGTNGYTLMMVSGIPQWTLQGTLGVSGGGTNCTIASGTCLDNITGFSTTGYINRTGSGTYTFSTVIPVSSGGTSLANGTSGGVLAFTGSGTIASSGVLAQYGIVMGGGAGATPATLTNGTAGQILQAQTSANPAWNTLSGDATITSGGAITVSASAITNSKLANANAYTFKGNTTSGSAAPTDFTPGSLANKASPAAGDFVVIADNAASGALKYATVSAIGSAGSVASIAGNTGLFTLAGGVTNSTNQIQMDGNYTGFANSNCTLAASVGSNLLTVALKTNAGSDPSATSPCYLNFRNSTSGTGSTSLSTVTAATSISTFATGATLGSSSATAFRFWVVVFNNGGAVFLGLYNASISTQCFPIDETQVQSSTSMTSGSTSAGVYYSPNGLTAVNLPIRILGYVEYNPSGLTTAGTYTRVPDFIQTFSPGVHRPCETISTRLNEVTTLQTSSGATFPSVASPGNTISATLTSAANLVRVSASASIAPGAGGTVTLGLYEATGSFACTSTVGYNQVAGPSVYGVFSKVATHKPNSTAPIYGFCFGVTTATGTAGNSDLLIEEIMG